MKYIKFIFIALVVIACHKKNDDPKPVETSTTSSVFISINSYKYYITQVRYKIRTYADSNSFTYKTFDSPSGVSPKITYTGTNGFFFYDTTVFDKGVLQEIMVTTSSNDPAGSEISIYASDINSHLSFAGKTFPFEQSNTSGTIFKDSIQFKAR